MKAKVFYILALVFSLAVSSCSEYTKLQKSGDNDLKFAKAKEYYEKGKYLNAASLLESVVHSFRGTEKGEEALFLLAKCHLMNEDYMTARSYFSGYHRSYPRGRYAEQSKFYVGYCYYKDSPEVKLDQTSTKKAVEELNLFIDIYPQSAKVPEAQSIIQEMNDKLAYKAYLNAKLYFNLGNYMGNNYESAVIVAKNAIKDYPYSKYKEELELLVLKARYQEASQSVDEKKADRFRVVLDEYYSYINNYPDSPNKPEQAYRLSANGLERWAQLTTTNMQ